MFKRLFLIGAVSILPASANQAGPSEFYIVSAFFSDNGAQFYYYVLDIKPTIDGSLVRYSRIAPRSLWCQRKIVETVEKRVPNVSPAQLVEQNNPCAVDSAALKAAIKNYAQRGSGFETVSYGIEAQCGDAKPISLALPQIETVRWDALKAAHPELTHLWDLAYEVANRVFGSTDMFHNRTEEDDLALQQEGERLVPELVAGHYDAGLTAAFKGNVGDWHHPSFRSLLEGFRGPISISQSSDVPRLLNADQYRFSHFVAPAYPPLAEHALVQGKVELRLTVNQATGEVTRATVTSGHPLLKDSAIAAAKEWRFVPNATTSETVNVTFDFALRCPVL